MRRSKLPLSVLIGLATLIFANQITFAQESVLNAGEKPVYTLDKLYIEVLQANPRVVMWQKMEQASQKRIGPAGAWDDPMAMVGIMNLPTSFDFAMDPMTMRQAGLSQRIPISGYKGLLSRAARMTAEATKKSTDRGILELLASVKHSFAELFYTRAMQTVLQKQKEALTQIATIARSKLITNRAGQEEVLMAEADLARLEEEILMLQKEERAATAMLNSFRGKSEAEPIGELALPTFDSLPVTPESWIALTDQNNPELQRLILESKRFEFESRANFRMLWPMVDLNAAYGVRQPGPDGPRDNMITTTLSLNLPVFAPRKQISMGQEARLMAQSISAERLSMRLELVARIRTLFAELKRLDSTIAVYQTSVLPAIRLAYQTAVAGYASDRVDFIRLIMIETTLYQDELTLLRLQGARIQTEAQVEPLYTSAAKYRAILEKQTTR